MIRPVKRLLLENDLARAGRGLTGSKSSNSMPRA
jgi:hypothetical protein